MRRIIRIISIMVIMLVAVYIIPIYNINQVQAANGKDIVIVIDPGHGGDTSGATNSGLGIREDVINLKVARGMKEYLAPYYGINVILTHNGLPLGFMFELVDRGMVARNNNADMMISIHFNDSTNRSDNGAEVYVTANTSLPKYNYESTRFGNIVLKNLSALGIANRGVKTRLSTDPEEVYSDGTRGDYYGVIRYPMKGNGEGARSKSCSRRRNSRYTYRKLLYKW